MAATTCYKKISYKWFFDMGFSTFLYKKVSRFYYLETASDCTQWTSATNLFFCFQNNLAFSGFKVIVCCSLINDSLLEFCKGCCNFTQCHSVCYNFRVRKDAK